MMRLKIASVISLWAAAYLCEPVTVPGEGKLQRLCACAMLSIRKLFREVASTFVNAMWGGHEYSCEPFLGRKRGLSWTRERHVSLVVVFMGFISLCHIVVLFCEVLSCVCGECEVDYYRANMQRCNNATERQGKWQTCPCHGRKSGWPIVAMLSLNIVQCVPWCLDKLMMWLLNGNLINLNYSLMQSYEWLTRS